MRSVLLPLCGLVPLILCMSCQHAGVVNPGDERRVGDGRYDGPPVSVDVLVQRYVEPLLHIAVIEITTPTGGWEAMLDHTEVEHADDEDPETPQVDTARLFVTLQGPGEDEMVTQALVNHHITFRSEEPFDEARVFVRHYRSGEPAGEYRLAAQQRR